jgi:acyl dehydratase
MPLDSTLVGTQAEPRTYDVDARWTMAYAAALGDVIDRYIDTRRAEGIVAHPLFPVCLEWPTAGALRTRHRGTLTAAEAARGVHATHHAVIHRAIRPPERLTTRAEIVGIEARKAGAYEITKFETVDERGGLVNTTWYGTLYRQVGVTGGDRTGAAPAPQALEAPPARVRAEMRAPVSAGAAHIYTECARIWNPIHTDAAVAAAAGLPGIILHGTATLAMSVSRIIAAEAGGDPERVAEISGRFSAMVFMPSELAIRILVRERRGSYDAVFFETLSAEGGRAIRDGVVMLRR